ncbi:MAG: glycosyltransferase family 2 protein [Rhodospirillaceae bacterium]|nr:glycosyltransferase family 2 protein [Rhodospirillaceae bacterium]
MIHIILAVWNGADTIQRTLDALTLLESPGCPWQLLVVDNGSTDATPQLLPRYGSRLPMSALRQPRPGKGAALNLALDEIDEGLVVFIDADIVPARNWLKAVATAAERHDDFALLAGRIEPLWEVEPPSWLASAVDLDACFGVHAEREEGPCPHYLMYGGNMAIRFGAIGANRFDESFGPFPSGSYAMGGETEFVGRLSRAGAKAWYCRGAAVRHLIPASHIRADWLLDRAANFGRGQCRVDGDPRMAALGWRRSRQTLRREMRACQWRLLSARLRHDTASAMRARWRLGYLSGYAAELAEIVGMKKTVPQGGFPASVAATAARRTGDSARADATRGFS